ncbi:alpha-N-acetylgalactosaminide alpha-2,6-sialyltransferase 3-like [Amphiura filiformis]|uniref:alpha-N-acetylgalactosaminide alpha-2,6-sialyltransferase 3-like n=1 Tax=Amphiura filiformis TaxID=82378 RepID=UPI003B210FB3
MVAQRPSVRHFYRSMKDFQPLDKSCSSCAIVSSSGQLLGKGAGKEIDNASCVLRMNTAPVTGFEEDVGARTTLRILCFISVKALQKEGNGYLLGPSRPETVLFWGLNQEKHKSAKVIAEEVFQKYIDSVDFYSQTQEGELEAGRVFMNETGFQRADTNTWLSTGWFTIMLALDMCREIKIYGMVPEEYCKTHQKEPTKYHYYQKNQSPTECGYYASHEASRKGGHRFITEKAVFAKWAKKFNISLHHPEWDLDNVNLSKPIDTPFAHRQVVLQKERQRWKHTMNILFKVIAVIAALICSMCPRYLLISL